MRRHRLYISIFVICIIILYWQLFFFDGTAFLSEADSIKKDSIVNATTTTTTKIQNSNHHYNSTSKKKEDVSIPTIVSLLELNNNNNNNNNNTNNTNDTILKCFSWVEENSDVWATHHPTWEVTLQNDTHLCFEEIDTWRTQFIQKIYNNQWYGNCSDVFTDYMWSSGWAADFSNVANGLLIGFLHRRPFQIGFVNPDRPWWHYSAMKNGEAPVCPTKDMFCYFLPLSNCSVGTIVRDHNLPGNYEIPPNEAIDDEYYMSWPSRQRARAFWLASFATRPQHFFRKQLYDFIRHNVSTHFTTPCTAIHVRRTDVVLHAKYSRKYFPISDYIQKIPKSKKEENIFLMTDDANAIDEALEFYPDINWMYLERKRHRGSEGGWENQIPSKNPALEVLYILAEFELAKKCDLLVHGKSGFADWILFEMRTRDKNIQGIRVDTDPSTIHHLNNSNSEQELNETLNQRRNQSQTI